MSTLYVNTITPNSGDTVTVSGSLTTTGKLTIGDATSDIVVLTAEVSSSIIPDATATYDLGTMSKAWRNLHAHGLAHIHTASIGEVSSSLLPDTGATYALGTMAKSWGSLHVHGLGHIHTASIGQITSSLIPGVDNQVDLGSSGKQWKDLYVDGTANLDNTDIDGSLTVDGAIDLNATTFDVDASGALTIDSATSIAIGANADVAIDIDSAALDIDASGAITIDAAGAASHIAITTAHTAGQAFHLDADANAGSIVDIDAGILDIDVTAAATLDAVGVAIGAGSGELDLTTTGTMDVNAAALDIDASAAVTIDSVGLSIDNAGVAANITSTTDGAGEDFTIALAGATDSSLILSSAGTIADALQIKTTAGGMDITVAGAAAGEDLDITSNSSINVTATENAANAIYLRANGGTSETILIHSDQGTGANSIAIRSDAGGLDIDVGIITIDTSQDILLTAGDDLGLSAADVIDIQTTSADGNINIHSAHTAGQAILIDANANAGSILDIDAGILDIDVQAAATIDAVGVAIGAGSGELDLTTTGTMDVNSAALDIDTSGAITIDAAGAASHIAIVTAHTAGQAFHLDADANAGSIVDIDAGILDIDVTAAATLDAVGVAIGAGSGELDLTTTGLMDINSAALDIDTSGAITIDAAGAASHIAIVTAHTAGDAFHLDANADAGSIVKVDAGILDINVTAAATLDAVGVAIGAGSGELDLTTTGLLDINSAALDIDTSGAITIDAAGVASHIAIVTAHTAGQAFHLDADANAGSIVDIDAGILDIDVTGAATIDAASLVVSGIRNKNVVEQSGTAAEDLTAVAQNVVWYSNAAQAGAITLPQATADNVGMVIKIIVGTTDWSATAFKLGFANGGSTVLTGYIRLGSNAGSEAVDGFVVTVNAKSLEIDADDVTAAGGAIGSTYTFTYLEANLVHVEANGQVTTGTPALDAAASTTTGTS